MFAPLSTAASAAMYAARRHVRFQPRQRERAGRLHDRARVVEMSLMAAQTSSCSPESLR